MRDLPVVKCGNIERRSFAKVKEVKEMPYLAEVQKDSYNAFIQEGIDEVLEDYSPVTDFADHFELYFLGHNLDGKPKYYEKECRDRDATFAVPLEVKVRLVNKLTGDVVESDVFMGDLPKMTDSGSFIINGAERVVVSQIVRSPGVYNTFTLDKTGKKLFETTVMPNRGAWLEFEQDVQNILWVHVDRTRKITASSLLKALGFGTKDAILEIFGNDQVIVNTLEKDEKDNLISEDDGLYELYRRLRPGEMPTKEAVRQHIKNLFFDSRRYDLARVGRYKFNKRLCLGNRLAGCVAYEDIVNEYGEILVTKGETITEAQAFDIQNNGINEVLVDVREEKPHKIIGNNTADFKAVFGFDPKPLGLLSTIYYPVYAFSKQIAERCKTEAVEDVAESLIPQINDLYYAAEKVFEEGEDVRPEDRKQAEIRKELRRRFVEACKCFYDLIENGDVSLKLTPEQKKSLKPLFEKLQHKHVTVDDIIASISLNIDLNHEIGTIDNIDHLGNRRVRSVGELLQNQFRIGIARLERVIKERMSTQDPKDITPKGLINARPVSSAIREFFGSSQLSQFMDQTNPIAELTHKRKLSALGPGGLNRERATFEVRDVHYTHYGRMCPIETPEGQNIGLITSLSSYAKVNEFGFIESAYRKVDKETGIVTDQVDYLTADEEDRYVVAQANEPLDENGRFVNERVSVRIREDMSIVPKEEVDYMDVSPKQLVSVATALIPFLENSDTKRALMGSNMQRQAVPLLKPENAIVATGIEGKIAYDSGVMTIAKEAGTILSASGDKIELVTDDGEVVTYHLKKFERSNQSTCLNQKPIVNAGDRVEKGTILADGPATANGELALGRNILIAYMTWEGYNYEDAILLSEELVQNDIFTSIHIEEYETEVRETKLGDEEITRDIPNHSEDTLKDLDENGIIRIGAEVRTGDILVGKVTPKGEVDLTPEERLLRAIFGEKVREVKDTSLKVPHGESGVVIDVKIFTKENKDELEPGVNKLVRVYIAQKRKISVGDKMAGRYGNKGVISRILPKSDMPFLADGTPIQIVLNPLGVPSRMNIGQVLEVHLGLACKALGLMVSTPIFDSATEKDIHDMLEEQGYVNEEGKVDGKVQLYDGRTGEPFENKATVGMMYMIKLHHLVDDKIHARSIGPYSLVTQQPLGGKAQFGGQRFGEMEVWALEAYGAAHILQEMLTVKSDDVVGRLKTYDSIVNGDNISEPGIPESFKVLLKELQACALDIKVLTENNEEISLKELTEENEDYRREPKRDTRDEVVVKLDDENVNDNLDNLDDDIFGEEFQDEDFQDEEFSSKESFSDFEDLDDFGDDFDDDDKM